jgi:hypothetical protein
MYASWTCWFARAPFLRCKRGRNAVPDLWLNSRTCIPTERQYPELQ